MSNELEQALLPSLFIQSNNKATFTMYSFFISFAFPGNWTHDLGTVWAILENHEQNFARLPNYITDDLLC